jgi:hypothetical protein
VGALLAGFGGYALSALAANSASRPALQLKATGPVVYSWRGDPSRGCAASGVCGVQGALILRPFAGEVGFSSGGTGVAPINVAVGITGIVRVQRTVNGATAGECVDAAVVSQGVSIQVFQHRGKLTAAPEPAPSSGACAGPVSADFSGVTLPVKRSGARYPTFDMRGTRTFAAGPFTATVDSTLVVRSAPVGGQSFGSSGSSSSSSAAATPVPPSLVERVNLRYRVSVVPSSLDVNFADAQDGSCPTLDSCGASGSLALSLPDATATVGISASREVRQRVTSRQALADFRAGRLALNLPGFAELRSTVRETFSWPGTIACNDSVAGPTFGLMVGAIPPAREGGRVPVTLQNQSGADIFRTHCPGPSDADALGRSPEAFNVAIARTSISRAQLLSRRTALSLSNPGTFISPGYSGGRTGAVELQLTLVGMSAGTTTQGR